MDLHSSPFAPTEWDMSVEEYRGYLQALYQLDRWLFVEYVRKAEERELTLLGDPALVAVLYDALSWVGQRMGVSMDETLVHEVAASGDVDERDDHLQANA